MTVAASLLGGDSKHSTFARLAMDMISLFVLSLLVCLFSTELLSGTSCYPASTPKLLTYHEFERALQAYLAKNKVRVSGFIAQFFSTNVTYAPGRQRLYVSRQVRLCR